MATSIDETNSVNNLDVTMENNSNIITDNSEEENSSNITTDNSEEENDRPIQRNNGKGIDRNYYPNYPGNV